VPEELAEHWQETLRFLEIVTDHAGVLAGWMRWTPPTGGPADLAQAAAWTAGAAGRAGSPRADRHQPVRHRCCARWRRCRRAPWVLPGLDRGMDEDTWARSTTAPATAA